MLDSGIEIQHPSRHGICKRADHTIPDAAFCEFRDDCMPRVAEPQPYWSPGASKAYPGAVTFWPYEFQTLPSAPAFNVYELRSLVNEPLNLLGQVHRVDTILSAPATRLRDRINSTQGV
jgi:hypothetical protein